VLAVVIVVAMRDVGPPLAAIVVETATVLAPAAVEVAAGAAPAAAKPSKLDVLQANLRLALRLQAWFVFLAGSVLLCSSTL
jgi:hypothetical protein